MLPLEDRGTVKVNFMYTTSSNGSSVAVTCKINTGLEFPVNLDRNTETGSVIVDSNTLRETNTEFGTYLLTLILHEGNKNYSKDMVLYYEEPIKGFKVIHSWIRVKSLKIPQPEYFIVVRLQQLKSVHRQGSYSKYGDIYIMKYETVCLQLCI